MALKDCIKKLGKVVNKADILELDGYISDGLTDQQAVRKLLIGANQNVIDIVSRAGKAGATLAPGELPAEVSDLVSMQGRNLEKFQQERQDLVDEGEELLLERDDIVRVEDEITAIAHKDVAILDDQELLDALSATLFKHKKLKAGVLGLKGNTPLELFDSYKALQARNDEIQKLINENIAKQAALAKRIDTIFSGERRNVYFQREDLRSKKKGSITFDEETNKAIIRLTEARDLSTFLHESGHLYLEILGDLSELPEAPQETINDFQRILNYLGVEHRGQIGTEQHELWARSFEVYLREGKAPSIELQDAFSAFRAWLVNIYRKLTQLNVELTDDIRGVMDRLVATDDAIAEAERAQELLPLFGSAESMGVSQEVFDVYLSNVTKAHKDAFDKEADKMLKAFDREAKAWWQLERDKVEKQVIEEVHAMPVYQALTMFQKGKNPDGTTPPVAAVKLSKESVLDVLRGNQETLNRLPRPFIYRVKGGVHVDVAANMYGYDSGLAMLNDIMKAPKMEAFIEAETNARMAEDFPDPLVDGTLASDSVTAVHNEKRAQMLAAEMRSLRRQMRKDQKIVGAKKREAARADREAKLAQRGRLPKRGELAMIKMAAKGKINGKRIRDVRPNTYLAAEKKAARKAFIALEKRDYYTAYLEKQKEIYNHELYRAAERAKDEAGHTQKYLKKFDSRKVQAKLGRSGILERILAVIEGIDFRKVSLKQVDRDKAQAEILEAVEDGRLIVPPETLAKLRDFGTNWKDLTVEEFRGMRDVVRQLEHDAKKEVEMIVNDELVIFDKARDELVNSTLDNNKVVKLGRAEKRGKPRRKEAIKRGIHHWLNSGSMARILDNEGFGAFTRNLIVPIRRAYTEKFYPMSQQASEDVAKLYMKHYENAELTQLGKAEFFEPMQEEFSKSDFLSIALNSGSETNIAAMRGGMVEDALGNRSLAYSEQEIRAALATLDARDWAFVQDVWDYLDTYWAELSAAEQRRRGIAPQKVEAMPFTIRTSDGQEVTLRGGYYPLRYDPRGSDYVKADDFADMMRRVGNGVFVSANTRAGATYERTRNHGRVVRLGLGTIESHLTEIIRDIALGDEVNFVKRLLNDQKVRAAMKNTGNQEALDELNLWLTDAAVGELPANTVPDQMLSWGRVGFTKSKLAFNVFVTALQLTGIFQSMAMVGSKSYAIGFGKFLQDPVGQYQWVMENSAFMHARYGILQQFQPDIADTRAYLQAFFGPAPTKMTRFWDAASHYYFWPIAKMQSLVDVTTWLAAYNKGMREKGLSESDSRLFADSQVEGAQTSGIFADRSGLERGTLGTRTRQAQFVRLWTTLISYMLRKGNIAYEKVQGVKKNPTPSNIAMLMTDLVLLYMVEGIASALIYGRLPDFDDDDDAEELAAWVAIATLDSVVAGIPLLREVSVARYGSGNTPVGAVTKDMWDLIMQTKQGEADAAFWKTGMKVGGTLFHLPASQTNRAIDAIMSDDPELHEYVTGKRD